MKKPFLLFLSLAALDSLGFAHVHLKDRTSPEDMNCRPAGEGCIPIAEIVSDLAASGYTGWYTVEQYGSRRMLEDSAVSIRNVSAALAAQ